MHKAKHRCCVQSNQGLVLGCRGLSKGKSGRIRKQTCCEGRKARTPVEAWCTPACAPQTSCRSRSRQSGAPPTASCRSCSAHEPVPAPPASWTPASHAKNSSVSHLHPVRVTGPLVQALDSGAGVLAKVSLKVWSCGSSLVCQGFHQGLSNVQLTNWTRT